MTPAMKKRLALSLAERRELPPPRGVPESEPELGWQPPTKTVVLSTWCRELAILEVRGQYVLRDTLHINSAPGCSMIQFERYELEKFIEKAGQLLRRDGGAT